MECFRSPAKERSRRRFATRQWWRRNDNDSQLASSDATCKTGCTAQLLLSVQFIQHSYLLCFAVSPRSTRNGDDGGIAAVGCSVARQLIQAQDLDIQRGGGTDFDEFC